MPSRSSTSALLGSLFALTLVACAVTPPARWVEGGAAIELPRARWVYAGGVVDVMPDGRVLIDSEEVFALDRAGRVSDVEGEPLALLEPDGRVVAPSDRELGSVGSLHASRPGEPNAWLTVEPSGRVVGYGPEGERMNLGAWVGCGTSARAHQTCTLVTHLLVLRARGVDPEGGVGFGIGVGVGVRVR